MRSARRSWIHALALAALALPGAHAAAKPAAARLPAPKESWLIAESPSFTVIGNVSAKKVSEIADTLERFRSTLLQLKPTASAISPVPTLFVAFTNDRSFDPYKSSPDPRDVKWVGAFQTTWYGNFFAVNAYPERGSGMAIVFEGYAAHFIRSNYPSTPLWLAEGLSELYGTFRIEEGVADVGRPSAENLELLSSAPLLPLREILAMTPQSPGYAVENRSIFEAQAWVLVHYLLHGTSDGHARTADFLRRLDAGEEQAAAFAAAFGVEVDKFEGRLRLYATQRGFDYQRVVVGDLPPTLAEPARPLPYPEALTLLAALPASMRKFDFAQAHLEVVIAEQPGNGDAWALAGWIAEQQNDLPKAAESYRRALAGELKQPASWVHIGNWQLAAAAVAAAGAGGDRESAAAPARHSAERALALAPEFGEASALRGRAALRQEEYLVAIAALAEAQLRLPERADIVYNRVVAHLGAGQLVQARALVEGRLRRLAEPAQVAQAREMVARSEASKWIEAAIEESNRAGSAGDLEGAIAALVAAQGKVATAEGKEFLARRVEELQQAMRQHAKYEAYDAVVAKVNAGRLKEGRDALVLLLADCEEEPLCSRARELQTELERRLKGRP